MFRRIHSNRDPGNTLYREIKNEFGSYFEKAETTTGKIVQRNPRGSLIVMCLLMLLSAVLSFTVFRGHEKAAKPFPVQNANAALPVTSPVSEGFDQILSTTSALQQTLGLKKEVESLLAKPKLTPADSAQLEKALDRLGQLQQHVTQQP
ncbi:hypothetical protein [Mucilaginibacter sp. UYCu711]|uniref:hypothetical protein n=1 Tax=Mucilaginibacter sp. UYCu711 TaxID=3156339 RepID=UPI003D1E5B73